MASMGYWSSNCFFFLISLETLEVVSGDIRNEYCMDRNSFVSHGLVGNGNW